jgi:catechol 2,3-dioxygenase-like lactoylglutathione lyase family enzyme
LPEKEYKMDALEFRFAFHARDFEKSVSFYRDVLAMPSVGGWDRPEGRGALLNAGGTAVIEIYGAARGQSYAGPPHAAINLALRVADGKSLETWHATLLTRGVQVVEPPTDRPWGHRSLIALDPDGIPVHLYCELTGSDPA